jgi:hypothetical protein
MAAAFVAATAFTHTYGKLAAEDVPPRRQTRHYLIGSWVCYLFATGAGVLAISAMSSTASTHFGPLVAVAWFIWSIVLLIMPDEKGDEAAERKRQQRRDDERNTLRRRQP